VTGENTVALPVVRGGVTGENTVALPVVRGGVTGHKEQNTHVSVSPTLGIQKLHHVNSSSLV